MLEGLEISEIDFSDLERTVRIDSEFYKTENLNFLNTIIEKNPRAITEFVSVSDGNHLAISDHFSQEGVPYYRGGDIYNFYIEQTPSPLRIPEEVFNIGNMKRSHLKKGDVLISIVGAIIGNLSLVQSDSKATCSCKLAILRPSKIKPELLAIYLKSKFGQNQVQKFRRGTGQTGLILEDFEQLLIPEFSNSFAENIESLVANSYRKLESSQNKYTQAETLLLETLGLKDFEPSSEAVNIKGFAESFATSGRLDAEHYQIKYDKLEEAFNKYRRKKLGEIINYPVSSGITPKAGGSDYTLIPNEGFPFIRAVDLKNGIVDDSKFIYIKPHIHNGILKRTQLKKNDVLFSIAGTVGRCGLFLHDFEANINQAVSILRFDEIDVKRLYLICLFNSSIGKLFVSKYSRQGLQTNLNLNEVAELSIPIIEYSIQQNISDLIEESFQLKTQSEQLLALAKTAVEKAIEENEAVAMAHIKAGLEKIGLR